MTDRQPHDQDRAAVHFPPPLIYVGALIAGWAIERWLMPLGFDRWVAWSWSVPIGVAVCVGALVLALMGLGLFRRTGQEPEPWTPTPELITTGVYRFSRNPMYLGMALFQLGVDIAALNAWMIALIPVSMLLVYRIAIRHEEAYLERKFGDPFREYKMRVRRWV